MPPPQHPPQRRAPRAAPNPAPGPRALPRPRRRAARSAGAARPRPPLCPRELRPAAAAWRGRAAASARRRQSATAAPAAQHRQRRRGSPQLQPALLLFAGALMRAWQLRSHRRRFAGPTRALSLPALPRHERLQPPAGRLPGREPRRRRLPRGSVVHARRGPSPEI